MKWLLLFLVAMAFYHFIYEGIIAPSVRLNLRFKLFRLRDRLRELCENDRELLTTYVYSIAEESINSAIKALPRFNFGMLVKAERSIQQDENLREEMLRRVAAIDGSDCEEVKHIMNDTNSTLMAAFLVNVAGWVPYLIPVVIFSIVYGRISKMIRDLLTLPSGSIDMFESSDESTFVVNG